MGMAVLERYVPLQTWTTSIIILYCISYNDSLSSKDYERMHELSKQIREQCAHVQDLCSNFTKKQ